MSSPPTVDMDEIISIWSAPVGRFMRDSLRVAPPLDTYLGRVLETAPIPNHGSHCPITCPKTTHLRIAGEILVEQSRPVRPAPSLREMSDNLSVNFRERFSAGHAWREFQV